MATDSSGLRRTAAAAAGGPEGRGVGRWYPRKRDGAESGWSANGRTASAGEGSGRHVGYGDGDDAAGRDDLWE